MTLDDQAPAEEEDAPAPRSGQRLSGTRASASALTVAEPFDRRIIGVGAVIFGVLMADAVARTGLALGVRGVTGRAARMAGARGLGHRCDRRPDRA